MHSISCKVGVIVNMFSPTPVDVVGMEHVIRGYHPWQVGLGVAIPPVDPSFRYKQKINTICVDNKPMAVGLGVEVVGAVSFWPDTSNQDGAVLGVMKRIATLMPDTDEKLFEEFEEFSKNFIVENMKECILPSDTDLSVERWLEGTHYSGYRKAELMEVWRQFVALKSKDFDVMSHVKYESYDEPKHYRGIYSRSDAFKCQFGPVCAAISKKFFHMRWFVKYLGSSDKMARMRELFDNDFVKVFTNDFSSFEATFTKLLMRIEVFFFEHCTQNLPNRDAIMGWVRRTKFGVNRLVFRKFMCWLQSKRYSGEMDTSLSNSLVNLLFMCFLLHKSGHPPEFYLDKFPPQIEGDDSLGAFVFPLDDTILLRLGAKAKIEYFDNFSEASFCGMVFSGETNSIIRDPISAILDFGYVNYKYLGCSSRTKKKLIRAKGLSLLHSYPGCPVLKSLAMYALRVTGDIDDKHAIYKLLRGETSIYHREKYSALLDQGLRSDLVNTEVEMSSRLLMEQKFHLTVDDQIAIEGYLDGLNVIQQLDFVSIIENCGSERIECYNQFSDYIRVKHTKGNPPKVVSAAG